MIKVELTEKEAHSFKKWREHQDTFDVLLENNIFEIKNGSAEIHFDKDGEIHNLKAHVNVYRKKDIHTPTIVLTKLL